MKSDIKLQKICFVIVIISGICLFVSIFVPSFFTVTCDQLKALIDFIIAISSGIFGSAITLLITKKIDYETKKEDLLTDYFFYTFKFTTIINGIIPTIPEILSENGHTEDVIRKSYIEFDSNRNLWNEMMRTTEKLYFAKKDDNIEQLIGEINGFYKEILPKIILNSFCYIKEYNNPGSINCVIDSMNDLFEINEYETDPIDPTNPKVRIRIFNVSYKPKAATIIIPKLQELEKIIRGKTTIEAPIFPSAIYKKDI